MLGRVLKSAKYGILRGAKAGGLFAAAQQLRAQRLLIICYHGISFEDEHLWNPSLYMDRATFRERLVRLRTGGYRVLPLGTALELLHTGRLPARSVVLTFDDGTYDFYAQAYPLLQEFGFPATLYLSSYYCRHQVPVFNPACSYVLWKGMGRTLDLNGLVEGGGEYHIAGREAWRRIQVRMLRGVWGRELSTREQDELLTVLAGRLGVDLERIRARRMLHYMTPREVREVAAGGIDIQLHTHRHRTPRERSLFVREIEDNTREIREMTGGTVTPVHFCYPSGDYGPELYGWLRELGIESATTCQPGLASRRTHPFELPRLLDMPTLSSLEFEGWLTGFSGIFPQRDARVLYAQRLQE